LLRDGLGDVGCHILAVRTNWMLFDVQQVAESSQSVAAVWSQDKASLMMENSV
jgi:hypothetical protein